MKVVEVVQVNNKLKVQVLGRPGKYVRFPKNLRKAGKIFKVDGLKSQGSFYTVVGSITELVVKRTPQKKKTRPSVPKQKFYISVEYPGHSSQVDSTLRKISRKVKFKETGSGFSFMDGFRDIGFSFNGTDADFTKKFNTFKKQVTNQAPKIGGLKKKDLRVSYNEAF